MRGGKDCTRDERSWYRSYFRAFVKYTPSKMHPMHTTCVNPICSPSSMPHPIAKIGMIYATIDAKTADVF